MLTDYKFWYIRRDDSGFIIEVAVRFYEGDITTESEKVFFNPATGTDEFGDVTRYRRFKRLKKPDLNYLKKLSSEFKKEYNDNDAVIYTQKDFGIISEDDDLRDFLNKELKKDKSRVAIDEQKVIII